MASIFSRMLTGEIPALMLYEDDLVYSCLDIFPVRLGHALVFPKKEVDYFVDVPEPYYSAVFTAAKRLSPAIQKATGAKRIATACVGLEVPHFHYHLIPIDRIEDFSFARKQKVEQADLLMMQKKILAALQ